MTAPLSRRLLAEFLGSALLAALVIGSGIAAAQLSNDVGLQLLENAAATAVTHQQVWMLDGEMDITVGATTWRLKKGDCLAMRLDGQVAFENRTRRAARYAVAVTTVAQEFAGRG